MTWRSALRKRRSRGDKEGKGGRKRKSTTSISITAKILSNRIPRSAGTDFKRRSRNSFHSVDARPGRRKREGRGEEEKEEEEEEEQEEEEEEKDSGPERQSL